jgi:hypothetical protein
MPGFFPLFAAHADGVKCLKFFLDPNQPLSVRIIICGAIGMSLFFVGTTRMPPEKKMRVSMNATERGLRRFILRKVLDVRKSCKSSAGCPLQRL